MDGYWRGTGGGDGEVLAIGPWGAWVGGEDTGSKREQNLHFRFPLLHQSAA